jgi:phosphatidylglycerol:prolipoprotein diacylglycerol transferase
MYPILLSFGPVTIHTYAVVLALGFFVAVYYLVKLIERASLNLQFLTDHFFSLVIFSLIGARLLYVLFYYPEFSIDFVSMLYIWDGGLIGWGGILAFMSLYYIFCLRNQENFSRWLDVLIIPALVWGIFESVAAFLSGESFGIQTSLPWGIQFDNPSMPFAGIPVHPVQIYSMIFLMFFVLWLYSQWSNKTRLPYLGYLSVSLYAFYDFFIEFLRGDYMPTVIGLRMTQIIALGVAIFFFLMYIKKRKEKRLI